LQARRTAAAERFAASSLPSTEEEIWRYSRIAELDLDAYVPTVLTSSTTVPVGVVAGEPDLLGSAMTESPDVFADLNDAFASGPLVFRVGPGAVVKEPLVVEHHVDVPEGAVFPRLVIEVGEDAEVTVVERFRSTDVHALVVPVVELLVHQNGRLRYLAVNELGRSVWQIGHQVARGERDSNTM